MMTFKNFSDDPSKVKYEILNGIPFFYDIFEIYVGLNKSLRVIFHMQFRTNL